MRHYSDGVIIRTPIILTPPDRLAANYYFYLLIPFRETDITSLISSAHYFFFHRPLHKDFNLDILLSATFLFPSLSSLPFSLILSLLPLPLSSPFTLSSFSPYSLLPLSSLSPHSLLPLSSFSLLELFHQDLRG